MKKHVLWLALAVAVFVLGTAWLLRRKSGPTPLPREATNAPAAPRFTPPAGNQVLPKKPAPEIPIEDGKTIDFSKGLGLVRDTEKDRAALERALKEIEAATQGVTFAPKAEPPPVKK